MMRFLIRMVLSSAVCTLLAAAVSFAGIPAGYVGKVFSGDTLRGHAQQIPGVIKLVFFDEGGGEGITFHDYEPAHQGDCCLRTGADSAVDMQIFKTGFDLNVDGSQADTGSWHLSWTADGEWSKFTIKVLTAGTYTISTYEAVANTPNTQTLTFNDKDTVTISNLATTSTPAGHEIWHNWKTFPNVGEVTLDTGLYVMKFAYGSSSFNSDKFIFTLKGGTNAVHTQSAASFTNALSVVNIGRSVSVSYSLAKAEQVRMSVVNCSGKTVLPLAGKTMSAGMHTQSFDAAVLSNGTYFLHIEHNGVTETRLIPICK